MTDLVTVASDLPHFINSLVLCAEQARASRLCFELTPKAFSVSHDGLPFAEVAPEMLPRTCVVEGSKLQLSLADVGAKAAHAAFAKALNGLRVEALLFLNALRTIDLTITYPDSDKTRRVSLSATSSFLPNGFGQLMALRASASAKKQAKTSAYLRFDDRESAANVGLAFSISTQPGTLRFQEAAGERLFTPFPVAAWTPFCFLIRGAYALTANGKSVRKDAAINKALVARTSVLLQQALRTISTKLPEEWCDTKTRLSLVDILPGYTENALFQQVGRDVERLYRTEALMPAAGGSLIALDQAWLLDKEEDACRIAGLFKKSLVKQLFHEERGFILPYGLSKRALTRLYGYGVKTMRRADLAMALSRNPTVIQDATDEWLKSLYTVFSDYFSPNSELYPSLCGLPVFRSAKGFLQPAFSPVSGGCWMPRLSRPSKRKNGADPATQLDAALYNANRDFFDNVLHLPAAC